MIFVIILLKTYDILFLYLKPIILKITGNKSNPKGYIKLVKKLIQLSFIKGICVL